jgi:molybdate transport system substrate-binding protein
MKKVYVLSILLCFVISSFSQVSPAVAANMKFAFEEIKDAFTKKTGYTVTPVYGASGKIVTQIRTGAPFDIFISADIAFADSVVVSKLNANKPKIYAYGKLVLWTLKPLDLSKGVSILADSQVKTIALGDLKATVYGPAAKKLLEKSNIWAQVESKVVYGESITKVAQFIATGSADIGFSAKSLVLSDELKGKGTWVDIDSTQYDPLPQAAIVLQYGEKNNQKIANELYSFLYSKEAQTILIRYGYKIP